jgi:hypothetical protein
MELVNTNYENSFDPTPRLKSSPIPIKFISFNIGDENCIYCGGEYISTLLCRWQRYCKKCLSYYINNITDNNIYLDVYIYTMELECSEHEISRTKVPQSIQECCGNCLNVLRFKQINGLFSTYRLDENNSTVYNSVIEDEKDCNLCGKSLYQGKDKNIMRQFKFCLDCYLISSKLIESTLVNKKKISILYLPWWYNYNHCDACYSYLIFTSDCQKYCAKCYIFYVGCRYCLTTNIIFGPTAQSQCRKCKRISLIINSSIKSDIDDFLLYNVVFNNLDKLKIPVNSTNIVKNKENYFRLNAIQNIIKQKIGGNIIGWIPYSQFKNVKEITKGGYGTIYKATWLCRDDYSVTVILKRFGNSKNVGKYFLNEVNI